MSWNIPLDEYTTDQLRAELKERERRHASGVCSYCRRDHGTSPSCKFPRRHNGTINGGDV